jgi:hypothetical protein
MKLLYGFYFLNALFPHFKALRTEFDTEAKRSGKPALIISAATAAGKSKIDAAYDIAAIRITLLEQDSLSLPDHPRVLVELFNV